MGKVLIVDDSLFMRMVVKDALGERYAILEADSGYAALKLFEKERPDIVLLDIVMPGGDDEGIRILQQIMKQDPSSRVVMLTAVGQEAVVAQCRKFGAMAYITKPFDTQRIVDTVEHCLGAACSR